MRPDKFRIGFRTTKNFTGSIALLSLLILKSAAQAGDPTNAAVSTFAYLLKISS
jgi:hypothetical protein